MELSMEIKFDSVDDVYAFTRVCELYESDINIYQQRWSIDGKSQMGIFALKLSESMRVEILTTNKSEAEQFYRTIRKYEVRNE